MLIFKRLSLLLCAICTVSLSTPAALAAAGGGSSGTAGGTTGGTTATDPSGGTTTTDPSALQVDIIQETLVLPDAGESYTGLLTSTITGAAADAKITWTSSDPNVVTVKPRDNNPSEAIVTASISPELPDSPAKAAAYPGEATITLTVGEGDGAKSDTCAATVSGIILTQGKDRLVTLDMYTNTTQTLSRRAFGAAVNVADDSWTWQSDDNSVAWVSQAGVITGVSEGTTVITCQDVNEVYVAKCTVSVTRNTTADLQATLHENKLELGSLISQLKDICLKATEEELEYITNLLVPASEGTLYYNYVSTGDPGPGVSSSRYYYLKGGEFQLSNITFIPTAGFSGESVIQYTGYTTGHKSYSGEIHVIIEQEAQSLSYTSLTGEAIPMKGSDLEEYCQFITGRTLRSVVFDLPSERYGALVYNHNSLSGSGQAIAPRVQYYYTGSPSIDMVSFVPSPGWTGTFTLRYTGTNIGGDSYSGSILITVKESSQAPVDGNTPIVYTTQRGQTLAFKPEDFNAACRAATNRDLSYVTFPELPSSQKGILWENGRKASSGRRYYISGDNPYMLSDISLEPDADFTGPFTISFVGHDVEGQSFTGTLTILVTDESGGGWGTYYATNGTAVTFQATDFIDACAQVLTGSLSKVQFTAPDAACGKLYINYASPFQYTEFVSNKEYTAATLSRISFVPKAEYTGTVAIPFTATDRQGNRCSENVVIQVTSHAPDTGFQDMGAHTWAQAAVAFLRHYKVIEGVSEFDYDPNGEMRRGDYALMLARVFALPGKGDSGFQDVPADSYYASAIAGIKAAGAVSGDDDGLFWPEDGITRQDAAVMLYRLLKSRGAAPVAHPSVLMSFLDAEDISEYAQEAMASLVQMDVLRGSYQQLHPHDILTRAEMAVILHRALT